MLEISLNNIIKDYPIGRGGYGKVWLIRMKGIQEFKSNATAEDKVKFNLDYKFALKEMSKAKIVERKSVDSIKNERKFLEILNSPFLVNMLFAFETKEALYLIMDYYSGGDLRYHIYQNDHRYTEAQTKFIVCCIILALEHLRSHNIVHRDLKPENLVFDSKGFIHLTDFGIAYDLSSDPEIRDTSGTPGYMAPEIFTHSQQTFAVDYFALGVITYELMMRKRPYKSVERKGYKEEVLSKEIRLKKVDLPRQRGWSDYSVIDFINGLLKRKAKERLGYNSITDIIYHPWLKDVNWENIYNKTESPPFEFISDDNFDEEYARKEDDKRDEDETFRYLEICNRKKYFKHYYYNKFEKKKIKKKMAKNKSTSDLSLSGLSPLFSTRSITPTFKYANKRNINKSKSILLLNNNSKYINNDDIKDADSLKENKNNFVEYRMSDKSKQDLSNIQNEEQSNNNGVHYSNNNEQEDEIIYGFNSQRRAKKGKTCIIKPFALNIINGY